MHEGATLDGVYRHWAADRPDNLAIAVPGRSYTATWADLVESAEGQASTLRSYGVERGTRVGVTYSSSPECLVWSLAVWTCGATVVPLDRQWGAWLRTEIINDAEVQLTVDPVDGTIEVRPGGSTTSHVPDPGGAFISYTSGSTGRPKGVLLAHRQVLDAYEIGAAELCRVMGSRPRRFGSLIDASGLGVFGHSVLWPAAMGSACVILEPLGVSTATTSLPALEQYEVDFCYLVPPLVALLTRAAPDIAAPLRTTFGTGGAPLSSSLKADFERRFGTSLLNFYGLTEVSFTAFFGTPDEPDVGVNAGIGRPGTVVARLRGADGRILHESPAEGMLEITGPSVATGYHRNATEWRELAPAGWIITGDVARRDVGGSYTIVGRRKDAVMVGGDTIYLGELEAASSNVDGVIEVAAVKLIGANRLEGIGLVVRLGDGTTAAGVRSQLAATLGQRRAPTKIQVADEPLPRMGHGKLDRRAIRDRYFPTDGQYGDDGR